MSLSFWHTLFLCWTSPDHSAASHVPLCLLYLGLSVWFASEYSTEVVYLARLPASMAVYYALPRLEDCPTGSVLAYYSAFEIYDGLSL